MSRHHVMLTIAATLALVSACGGGGGGGGGNSGSGGSSASSTPVTIDASNETAVSRATLAGGTSLAQAQVPGTSAQTAGLSSAPSVKSMGLGAVATPVQQAMQAWFDARRSNIASASAHPATTYDSSSTCGGGGSIDISSNDRDNSGGASAGDTATASFRNCKDLAGFTTNGTIALTITSATSSAQFSASTAFQQVTVAGPATTYVINGSASLQASETGSETDQTLTVGSSGLTVGVASSGYNDTITYGSGMTISSQYLSTPGETILTLTGSFSASSIAGQVTLATGTAIVQLDADDYPSAGQLTITGANGSSLVMNALNATQVQLRLYNGQTLTNTTTVDWTTLLAL